MVVCHYHYDYIGDWLSLVPSAMWPSVPKIIPEKQLGTAYALIFWVQNWGLMGVPALIGFVLNEYCKGPVVDGMQTYDYTLPMWIFAGFGVAALFFALWLKGENKKRGMDWRNQILKIIDCLLVKMEVCRNARCTSFLFITIQICSLSLSCDLLKISLIYVFPASKTAVVSS